LLGSSVLKKKCSHENNKLPLMLLMHGGTEGTVFEYNLQRHYLLLCMELRKCYGSWVSMGEEKRVGEK